jgi:hypothetical protein
VPKQKNEPTVILKADGQTIILNLGRRRQIASADKLLGGPEGVLRRRSAGIDLAAGLRLGAGTRPAAETAPGLYSERLKRRYSGWTPSLKRRYRVLTPY